MGTETSETSGNQVTMDDFKSLESTMSSQMSELREMIARLMQAKAPSAHPPPEIPTTLNRGDLGLEEEDADKYKDKEARSSSKGNRKGEFPHWYSRPTDPSPLY
jgi:hypothetical protein